MFNILHQKVSKLGVLYQLSGSGGDVMQVRSPPINLARGIHTRVALTVALYLSFLFRKLTFCSTMCPCNSSDNIHGEVRILCNLANCGFSLRDIEL